MKRQKSDIKKKKIYGYYSNTELVNHFEFLWPVKSLELQDNIFDKLCTLRSLAVLEAVFHNCSVLFIKRL